MSPTLRMLLDAIEKEVLKELVADVQIVVGSHHDTTVAAKKHRLAGKQWTVAVIRSFGEDGSPMNTELQQEETEFQHAVAKELIPQDLLPKK
jgi:hypothetical protein